MVISIIIPIYNSEKYIAECLQSILQQTYHNFELILVDDGSTDSSYSICKSYEKSDSRIHLVSKRNGGVSSARNLGLEFAKGKYIAFIDSDDYIAPNYLEVLMSKACHSTDFVFSGMCDVVRGQINKTITQKEYFWELNKEEDFIDFLYQPIQSSPCAKLYSNSIIKENNICFDTSLNCAEDRDFNLKYFDYIKQAVSTSYSGYYYRRDVEDSLTKKEDPHAFILNTKHWSIKCNYCNKRGFYSKRLSVVLANDLFHIANDEIIRLSGLNISFKKALSLCKSQLSYVNFPFLKKWNKDIIAPSWQKYLLINKCPFLLLLTNKIYLHDKKKG